MYHTHKPFDPEKCYLSHLNSHRFGYNGQLFNYRMNPDDEFHVSFAPVCRPIRSFHDECINAVKLIRDTTREKLVVLLSGGVDSELIAMSLIEAKIPFEAATVRFNDNWNLHDIKYAIEFTQAFGIKHMVIDLNIPDFFEKEAYTYADRTYCVSPIMLPTMWLADQVEGFVMMCASNPIILRNSRMDSSLLSGGERSYQAEWFSLDQVYDDQWYHVESERLYAWMRHFMLAERSACVSFFKFTPELLASFFLDPLIYDVYNDRSSEKFSVINLKLALYKKHFPSLVERPKFHGFEKIFWSVDAPCRANLVPLYPGANSFTWTLCSDQLNMFVR